MISPRRVNSRRRSTKRKIVFRSSDAGHRLLYDTAFNGPWTLTGYSLSSPEKVTNIVTIPGKDGELDLAYALTGEPTFKSRKLTISLENSDGLKADREALITDLYNRLEGKYLRIHLPDDETHYLSGSVHVNVLYSDTNHCALDIICTVDPYKEAVDEVFMDLTASSSDQIVILVNHGGRRVIPKISAYATGGATPSISVSCGTWSAQPTADTIMPEALAMRYGEEKVLTYSGSGHLVIHWREADL